MDTQYVFNEPLQQTYHKLHVTSRCSLYHSTTKRTDTNDNPRTTTLTMPRRNVNSTTSSEATNHNIPITVIYNTPNENQTIQQIPDANKPKEVTQHIIDPGFPIRQSPTENANILSSNPIIRATTPKTIATTQATL